MSSVPGLVVRRRSRRCARAEVVGVDPADAAAMNSPQAWSESIGSSVWSRSNRHRFGARSCIARSASIWLEQRHGDARAWCAARSASSAVEQRHQVLEVAREAGQQVVHHLVAKGTGRAGRPRGAARRASRLRDSGWIANTWPQPRRVRRSSRSGRSTGGSAAGGGDRRAAAGCASTNSAKAACCCAGVELVAVVEHDQRTSARRAATARRAPASNQPTRPPCALDALGQRRAADASCRCRPAPTGRPAARRRRERAQVLERRRVRAGDEGVEGRAPRRRRSASAICFIALVRARWHGTAACSAARRDSEHGAQPAARPARRRSRTGGRRRAARRSPPADSGRCARRPAAA